MIGIGNSMTADLTGVRPSINELWKDAQRERTRKAADRAAHNRAGISIDWLESRVVTSRYASSFLSFPSFCHAEIRLSQQLQRAARRKRSPRPIRRVCALRCALSASATRWIGGLTCRFDIKCGVQVIQVDLVDEDPGHVEAYR
jgi:hypothetical protein